MHSPARGGIKRQILGATAQAETGLPQMPVKCHGEVLGRGGITAVKMAVQLQPLKTKCLERIWCICH